MPSWEDQPGERLTANTTTGRVGAFYEKLRYTLDYQDENAIRRNAIERTLRRLSVYEEPRRLGEALVLELIRSGYVQNGMLPESVIPAVQHIIDRYAEIERYGAREHAALRAHTATAIEHYLFPQSPEQEAVFDAMHRSVAGYVDQKDHHGVAHEVFSRYVYIACRRAFLHDTPEETRYALWLLYEPHARDLVTALPSEVRQVAARFDGYMRTIDLLLRSDIPAKIQSRLHNESIYAALLTSFVRQYGADVNVVFGDPQRLEERVRTFLADTYMRHHQKIARSGTRAVLYILITKVLVGLAIELPYEIFVLGHVNFFSLAVNMAFFPLLLLFMVKTVRLPDEKNTDALVSGLERFVTDAASRQVIIRTADRGVVSRTSFLLFYLALSMLTFGGLLYLLVSLEFNLASMFLFLFFLTVVSYFGLRIRFKARTWTYDAESESTLGLLWYLLALPVTRTGRWITLRLSSVNVFVFFMDFILETPLKLMLASFDEFVTFTKEMRRDMQ